MEHFKKLAFEVVRHSYGFAVTGSATDPVYENFDNVYFVFPTPRRFERWVIKTKKWMQKEYEVLQRHSTPGSDTPVVNNAN